jgi:hypothetical protein
MAESGQRIACEALPTELPPLRAMNRYAEAVEAWATTTTAARRDSDRGMQAPDDVGRI